MFLSRVTWVVCVVKYFQVESTMFTTFASSNTSNSNSNPKSQLNQSKSKPFIIFFQRTSGGVAGIFYFLHRHMRHGQLIRFPFLGIITLLRSIPMCLISSATSCRSLSVLMLRPCPLLLTESPTEHSSERSDPLRVRDEPRGEGPE